MSSTLSLDEKAQYERALAWLQKRVRDLYQSEVSLRTALSNKQEELEDVNKYYASIVRDRESCYQTIHELHTQIVALKSVPLKETSPPAPVDWEQQGDNPPSTQAKLESIRADLKAKGISGEAYIARVIEVLIENEKNPKPHHHEIKIDMPKFIKEFLNTPFPS